MAYAKIQEMPAERTGQKHVKSEDVTTPTSEQYQEKFQDLFSRCFSAEENEKGEHSGFDRGDDRNYIPQRPGAAPDSPVSVPNHTQDATSSGQGGGAEHGDLSRQLHNLISSNSELGSRLLSLLLVSSGNAKEIISAVNKGDLDGLKKLNLKKSQLQRPKYTEKELQEFQKIEMEKRRKNTEASARFRIRKKQREHEKVEKLKQLHSQISELYVTIDKLLDENKFWKQKLEEVNEQKSKELLESIKKRRGTRE
ncbi:LAQU0S04e03884g1_1 [Lachancea quebecensis]|uniref:LAQU0S04e03884g1_1 n=1 Tax=Lachancea quebecensis TaxID=1654605 RepID=A0A0P1KQN9_9SACH|nr:LAQU0S04e03884g1_1 [Lachancea quebecensis]